jgi:hypothetical protein
VTLCPHCGGAIVVLDILEGRIELGCLLCGRGAGEGDESQSGGPGAARVDTLAAEAEVGPMTEWCAPALTVLLVGIVVLVVWAIPSRHRHSWGPWRQVKSGPMLRHEEPVTLTTGWWLLQERECSECHFVERSLTVA